MAKVDSTPDDDCVLITNARQLGSPPSLRNEPVRLPEWKTTDGEPAKFLLWELTQTDHSDFIESGRTYNADGSLKKYDSRNESIRFLAATMRDKHGHRLWPTFEEAKPVLGQLGRNSMELLLAAANRMNTANPASAEKNFEETPQR